MKWYLNITYHDDWFFEFDKVKDLLETLNNWWINDSDFSYKIIRGKEYSKKNLETLLKEVGYYE